MEDPIKKDLYDFDILDLGDNKFTSVMFPVKMGFISRKKKDIIRLTYLIHRGNLDIAPISDIFRDVFCGLLQIQDENGIIIHKEFLELEFYSSEIGFDSEDHNILQCEVKFKIIEAKMVSDDFKLDSKKLIRDYKLNKLI
jgi:hypothetical protein